jgi:hypothetical protein
VDAARITDEFDPTLFSRDYGDFNIHQPNNKTIALRFVYSFWIQNNSRLLVGLDTSPLMWLVTLGLTRFYSEI